MALWARLVRVFSTPTSNSPQGQPRALSVILDIIGRVSLAFTMLILVAINYPPFLTNIAMQNSPIGILVVFITVIGIYWLIGGGKKW